jgi:hypothetical protein
MPQQRPKVGGGTTEGTPFARQADPACNEHAEDQIPVTLEKVLSRENMWRAYERVVGNAGAPGVDGITVDELKPWLQARWEAIRKELLDGTYQPSPVRKVEIPKPDGGVRTLGIPTVVDRLIQQALYQALQAGTTRGSPITASAFVWDAALTTHWNVPASMSLPAIAGWSIWTWRSSLIA